MYHKIQSVSPEYQKCQEHNTKTKVCDMEATSKDTKGMKSLEIHLKAPHKLKSCEEPHLLCQEGAHLALRLHEPSLMTNSVSFTTLRSYSNDIKTTLQNDNGMKSHENQLNDPHKLKSCEDLHLLCHEGVNMASRLHEPSLMSMSGIFTTLGSYLKTLKNIKSWVKSKEPQGQSQPSLEGIQSAIEAETISKLQRASDPRSIKNKAENKSSGYTHSNTHSSRKQPWSVREQTQRSTNRSYPTDIVQPYSIALRSHPESCGTAQILTESWRESSENLDRAVRSGANTP